MLHEWGVCINYIENFSFGLVQFSVEFIITYLQSSIGAQHFTLFEVKSNVRNADPSMAFSSWMTCVIVDKLSRGSAHIQFTIFFGKLDTLFFELAHWWWPKATLSLLAWPSLVGSGLLHKRLVRGQSPINSRTKFPPLLLQVGIAFGASTRRKRKRFSFG